MVGCGGDEVSVMPVVYPRGTVSVSSLGYFCLLVHHINLITLLLLSFSEYTLFESISRRRGVGRENKSSQRRIRPGVSSI